MPDKRTPLVNRLMGSIEKAIHGDPRCIACDAPMKFGTQDRRMSSPSCTNEKCVRYGLCSNVWKGSAGL